MIFFYKLLGFIDWLLSIYIWIVIASSAVTWVNPDPNNAIIQFLRTLTEPLYKRIKRFIPSNLGGIDITPLLIIFALLFTRQVIIPCLITLLPR